MSAITATGFTLSVPKYAGDRRSLRLATRWIDSETAVLTAAGEMDAANVNELRDCAFRALNRCNKLIVDLSLLEFFGVEGLSAIDGIDDGCRSTGVRWALVPSPAVARVLRIGAVGRTLPTLGTVDAAVRQVSGAGRALTLVVR